MSHQTDGKTSLEAWDAVYQRLSGLQKRILDMLWRQGVFGATDTEIEKTLRIDPKMNTRTRRNELVELGLIIPTGTKRKSAVFGEIIGRKANVWAHVGYLHHFEELREPPKCERRLAYAKAAELLALELKRLARDLRTTDDSSWEIETRLEYFRLRSEFHTAEHEYHMKEDPLAYARDSTEG